VNLHTQRVTTISHNQSTTYDGRPMEQQHQTVLFCGNFVKDNIIHYNKSINQITSSIYSLGGSVTFGSLAFAHYIEEYKYQVEIVSNVNAHSMNQSEAKLVKDMFIGRRKHSAQVAKIRLPKTFDRLDQMEQSTIDEPSYLTSYNLLYNDSVMTNERTLTLHCRGPSMNDPEWLMDQISMNPLPAAIFFVPVAAEFDEIAVEYVMKLLYKKYAEVGSTNAFPLVCCDVQGFLRTFEAPVDQSSGLTVTSHSSAVMKKKLEILGQYIFVFKADLNEANAILRDDQSSELVLSPQECAKRIHKLFGFKVVCITMGPMGCVVSCKSSDNKIVTRYDEHVENEELLSQYVAAYKPKCTVDETGCGDTFLSCLIAELLQTRTELDQQDWFSPDQLFKAVKMACAATSFVVERIGPHGFASRGMANERSQKGEIINVDIPC
jgi:hypothetical protein